jgi:HTH-type transcriptional regulator, sugar sensing transcriptional regulator
MAERGLLLELRKLGLSATEARVYTSLLELGGGLVSTVARRAGVPRTNCYYILKTLAEKGFVSTSIQANKKQYLPESPRKLVLEHRSKLAVAESLVPALLALEKNTGGIAPKMKYYDGFNGVVTVLKESLSSKTEVLCYTHVKLRRDKFPSVLREVCRKQAEASLKVRMISPYDPAAEHFLSDFFPQAYVQSSVQLLFVNPREFSLSSEVTIFDDKVCVISLNPEENLGVVIESQAYAQTSRTIFNLSWLGATSFVAQ